MIIRKPAVAGQFYPDNKNELEKMVKGFFDKAKVREEKGELPVLIVPHAGYVYSGQTAAYGMKNLDKNLKNVILLSASHQSWFNGIAIDDSDYWETPLGKVRVDKKLGEKLVTDGVKFDRGPHLYEHSLEIELPFLQVILKDYSIIPLLIGQADKKIFEKLAEKISESIDWGNRGNRGNKENTVLIISSDLSHYPDVKTAQVVDKRTIEAIKTGELEVFERELEKLAKEFPDIDTFACGHEAIKVGMMVARKLGALKIKVLAQTNSGEVMGETGRVVGYASIGFYE